jgi:glutathione synthase/RimK-type ligase-like ATP-grasp enzyme
MSNNRIVIITNREDITADYVVMELTKRNVPFFRFNTEDFPHDVSMSFNLAQGCIGGQFKSRELTLPFHDITSIWYRRPGVPSFNQAVLDPGLKEYCVKESYYALDGVLATINCFWISDPFMIRKAENKPLQLAVSSKIGFQIPQTLISSSPADIKVFYEECDKSIVIKPIRSGGFRNNGEDKIIFTHSVTAQDLDGLDSTVSLPSIYQAKVHKRYDIRVTVIGNDTFATEIHSQGYSDSVVDWRRGENPKLPHKKHKLPTDIEAMCVALTKKLGLQFSAIDLVLSQDGAYYFLEINPNGQWAWIEERTGYKLTAALVDLLICGRS